MQQVSFYQKVDFIVLGFFQMALFLAKVCEENSTYLNMFLFDENLLPDIRLMIINELVSKKLNIKFRSMDNIAQFYQHIEVGRFSLCND